MDREARYPKVPLVLSLPTGLWFFSLGADVLYRSGRVPASWDEVAFFSLFAGLVVVLLTAVPGFVDEVIRSGRLGADVGIVALYVLDLFLRAWAPHTNLPFSLSVAGAVLLVRAGWLGGDLVHAREGAALPCLREVQPQGGARL